VTDDPEGMAWVPGGTFSMGSDQPGYPEEAPPRPATVAGFWMDVHPVTVAGFARFVAGTGYVTVAERPLDPGHYPALDPAVLVPGSMVFQPTAGPADLTDLTDPLAWWRYVPGACWAHPEGPGSTPPGPGHPVTHVCWEDVAAYAAWAGKAVPTEAEWERAARGHRDGTRYAWGEEFAPGGRLMANVWVGEFPWQNLKPAPIRRTTPVGSFPPNDFGLFDMTGNVWEWTADFYIEGQPAESRECCGDSRSGPGEPGGAGIPRRVVKGGSHLCAPNYCERYRPAARQPQPVESSMSHLGFRCVRRPG
jgi:formylglycine-generating enzyme required for sulfatase activity